MVIYRRLLILFAGNVEADLTNKHGKSKNIAMRKGLDLYANVVRCRSLPSYKTRHNDVDLVIIRENTEGEYSQLEHEVSIRLYLLSIHLVSIKLQKLQLSACSVPMGFNSDF